MKRAMRTCRDNACCFPCRHRRLPRTWLLAIDATALAKFDNETAADHALARKRAARRTAINVAIMMLLLIAGIVLLLLAR